MGITSSVAGLVGVTYGLIEAGQHGWGAPIALGSIAAGAAVLVGFVAWERRLSRQPGGEPLVDPSLFRSRSYTWGVVLIAVAVLAMMGVLFTMPQYFQGVLGADAMDSGLRLLPLVGGLIAGAIPADQLARTLGAKLTVTMGFVLLCAGLALGAATRVGTGGGEVAAWMAVMGAGMGLALATASSAALAELTEERSGIGSAVLQAVNKTGGPLGTAVLGSILSSTYLAGLHLGGVPAGAAGAARQSIFGAVAAAARLHSPSLLDTSRIAFVQGMDHALLVSAAFAAAGALLALLFLPGSRRRPSAAAVPTASDVVTTP